MVEFYLFQGPGEHVLTALRCHTGIHEEMLVSEDGLAKS